MTLKSEELKVVKAGLKAIRDASPYFEAANSGADILHDPPPAGLLQQPEERRRGGERGEEGERRHREVPEPSDPARTGRG